MEQGKHLHTKVFVSGNEYFSELVIRHTREASRKEIQKIANEAILVLGYQEEGLEIFIPCIGGF